MCFTNNPVMDYERYSAEQEARLDKLPKCKECGEPVQQDSCVCFEGKYVCDNYLEDLRVDILWGDDS